MRPWLKVTLLTTFLILLLVGLLGAGALAWTVHKGMWTNWDRATVRGVCWFPRPLSAPIFAGSGGISMHCHIYHEVEIGPINIYYGYPMFLGMPEESE